MAQVAKLEDRIKTQQEEIHNMSIQLLAKDNLGQNPSPSSQLVQQAVNSELITSLIMSILVQQQQNINQPTTELQNTVDKLTKTVDNLTQKVEDVSYAKRRPYKPRYRPPHRRRTYTQQEYHSSDQYKFTYTTHNRQRDADAEDGFYWERGG